MVFSLSVALFLNIQKKPQVQFPNRQIEEKPDKSKIK